MLGSLKETEIKKKNIWDIWRLIVSNCCTRSKRQESIKYPASQKQKRMTFVRPEGYGWETHSGLGIPVFSFYVVLQWLYEADWHYKGGYAFSTASDFSISFRQAKSTLAACFLHHKSTPSAWHPFPCAYIKSPHKGTMRPYFILTITKGTLNPFPQTQWRVLR